MKCANCRAHIDGVADLREHVKTPECRAADPWAKVVEARENRTMRKAAHLRKEILGIEIKPMPPEVIEARKAASLQGVSEVKRRMKSLKRQELKALMKPTNTRRRG